MKSVKQLIKNFTLNTASETSVYRVERESDANKLISKLKNTLVIGNRKSYSDSPLNETSVIKTERLNKFLSFDKELGILEVQSGVTAGQIVEFIMPQGWFLHSVPGTKYATIGGMLSSNTHGKNQFSRGSFAEKVISFEIITPSNQQITASKAENPEIFNATISGYGMAGFIVSVKIQLVKIKSSFADINIHKINSENTLSELKNYFDVKKSNSEFLIAWLDHFSINGAAAKVIFQSGNYSIKGGFKQKNSKNSLLNLLVKKLSFLISFFMKPLFIRVFNSLVWFKNRSKKCRVHLNKFLFPLDFIQSWNLCYGSKGFLQYHFVLPENESTFEHIFEILNNLKNKKIYSYLITIKKYKNDEIGHLPFSIDGIGIAMDFSNTEKVRNYLQRDVNEYILDKKGKVYLAKDSLLNKDQFYRMYETADIGLKTLKNIDPSKKLTSKLSERLGLKDY